MPEVDELRAAIRALEAQRAKLGDRTVEAGVAALRDRLAALEQDNATALPEGERKRVTVMFADLSGFTSLSETADAEDVRNLVNACFEKVGRIVTRYGGYIDKFIGDELMVLFGAPIAMEDHAARCLYAALEIRDAVAELGHGHLVLRDQQLSLHVGVNSGLVVAGAIGAEAKREYTVMGDAVNVAARLAARARPNEILVGAGTRRLAGDRFNVEALGPVDLKGRTQAQEVFRLLQPRSSAERLDGSARSRMVGRDDELGTLQELFREVSAARRLRSIAVIGPPGIGKSRLQSEFRGWLATAYPRASLLRGAALSHMTTTPYFIIAELLRSWAGLSEADSAEEARKRLHAALDALHIVEPDTAHSLAAIIGIEYQDDALKDLSPEERRAMILSAFARFVKAVAARGPVLLVFEDLHWADDLSLDLLGHSLSELQSSPVLSLTLTRPIPDPQSKARQLESRLGDDVHIRLVLNELTEESGVELVKALAPGLNDATVQGIVAKGQGNPFFIEEIVGTLKDQGLLVSDGRSATLTVDWADVSVPDTVWGVLAERIDRLPGADKRVIQSAAIVGRVFWEGLVAELAQVAAGPHLEELDERDFVYQLGAASFGDDWEWMFRHILVQEVAYSGLLKEARRAGHVRAARWLEQQVGDRRAEYATLLAHHYHLGEDWVKTAEFAEMAGDRAAGIFAYREGMLAYLQALRALDQMEVSPEVRQRQIATTVKLARVALYTPTEDVRKALQAATQYAEETGDNEGRVRIIAGMASWLYAAGQARPAFEMAMQAVAGARSAGLEELLAVPYVIVARAMFIMGEYQQCVEMLEQSNALVEKYGIDFDDPARYGFLGAAYFQLGEISKGDSICQENLVAAEQKRDIRRIATAHLYIGSVSSSVGRLEGAGEHLQAAARISEETGDISLKYASLGFLGYWHAQRDELEQAAECLDRAISLAAELDSFLYLPLWQAYRAEVYLRAGSIDEAASLAEQAVKLGKDTRQQACEAEAHRVLAWARHYGGLGAREDIEGELRDMLDLRRKMKSQVLVARGLYDLGAYLRLVSDEEGANEAETEASTLSQKLGFDWLPVPPAAPKLTAKPA